MTNPRLTILTMLTMGLLTGFLYAGDGALQLSLTPDIAVMDRTDVVNGISIGIWSENQQDALTLGIISGAPRQSSGVMYSILANYSQDYTGFQLALVNYSSESLTGLQMGTVNFTRRLHGAQIGLLNYAGSGENAVQIGLINIMAETEDWFTGFPSEIAPIMILANWRLTF